MLEFPREYFIDEVRDGFYVNGLMKRCWAAQLEALNDIAGVCEKYQIRWYADFGTLTLLLTLISIILFPTHILFILLL